MEERKTSHCLRAKECMTPDSRALPSGFEHAFKSGGEAAVAEWLLSRSMARARKSHVSPLWLAFRTARLKREEETLRPLGKSHLDRSPWLFLLTNETRVRFRHF